MEQKKVTKRIIRKTLQNMMLQQFLIANMISDDKS